MTTQQRLDEIQQHLTDFKAKLTDSEDSYKASLNLLTDPELRSLLMENHVSHVERQRTAITRLENLYRRVQDQSLDIR